MTVTAVHAPTDVTIRLQMAGRWSAVCGPVELKHLTEADLPVAAACCRDRTARMMMRHRFNVNGSAAKRQEVLADELLGPWAYHCMPFGVWVRLPRQRTKRLVGVRYLETGIGQEPVTCGGWIGENYRRRGYGSAALTAAVGIVYAIGLSDRITTATRHDNLAAQANLASVGFFRDGINSDHDLELQVWTHDPSKGSAVPTWDLGI